MNKQEHRIQKMEFNVEELHNRLTQMKNIKASKGEFDDCKSQLKALKKEVNILNNQVLSISSLASNSDFNREDRESLEKVKNIIELYENGHAALDTKMTIIFICTCICVGAVIFLLIHR